jgi:CheY-like chemotaxis protein
MRVLEVLRRAIAAEPQGNARVKVLIGFDNPGLAGDVNAAVRQAGFDPVVVSTGRDLLRRLHEASDIDVVLLDSALPDPGLASLLAQLRGDVYAGRLPMVLAASGELDETLRRLRDLYRDAGRRLDESRQRADSFRAQNLVSLSKQSEEESQRYQRSLDDLSKRYGAESLRVEDRLRRFAERYPNVWVVPADLPLDAAKIKRVLQERVAQADSPPLGEAQRKEYAERAMSWLGKIARGEVAGYDVKSAPGLADTLRNALASPGLSDQAVSAGIDVLARLSGSKEQRALAAILLDERRALPLRVQAADGLVRHIQRYSLSLAPPEVEALQQLMTTTNDKTLKPRVEVVVGSLRPDAKQTGERLKSYAPAVPGGK